MKKKISLRVRLICPARSVTQSAPSDAQNWLLEPVLGVRRHWPPLGTIEAGDPFSSLCGRMRFSSAEKAVAFAKKRGWALDPVPRNETRARRSSYLDNFPTDRRSAKR